MFTACGGEFSSPSGIIRSPYHPANYPQHRTCVYRVSAPRGQVIQIQFMYVHLNVKCVKRDSKTAPLGKFVKFPLCYYYMCI